MVFGFKGSKEKHKSKKDKKEENRSTSTKRPVQRSTSATQLREGDRGGGSRGGPGKTTGSSGNRRLPDRKANSSKELTTPNHAHAASTNRTTSNGSHTHHTHSHHHQPQQLKSALKTSGNNPSNPVRHSTSTQVVSNISSNAGGTSVRKSTSRPSAPNSNHQKHQQHFPSNAPRGTSATGERARAASPLKSAMKSSSKYNSNSNASNASNSTTNLPAVAGKSLATPVSPRAKHKYIGPIDVDDIPSNASVSTYTPSPNKGNNNNSTSIDVDDLPLYRNTAPSKPTKPPATTITTTQPTSTIKSAVKRTEAAIKTSPKPITSTSSSSRPTSPPQAVVPNQPPAVVTPPPTKSPTSISSGAVPTNIATGTTTRSSGISTRSSGVSTRNSGDRGAGGSGRHSRSNSNTSGFPFVYNPNSANNSLRGGDDMSIISLDKSLTDMSIMSRVSVHMDHFLAEMALADNAQLEQLAVEEMKHRQIIPQKIKKLDKKIGVLHEERDVLLGLIDQLQELVDNQEEARRKRREKRKEKKRLKKEKKKAKKKEAKEAAKRKTKQEQEAKAAKAAAASKAAAAQEQEEKEGDETDSDEEYLAQKAAMSRGESAKGTWWKDDEDKSLTAAPSANASVVSAGDPILGSSAGGLADDDEFAKLWNDSFSAGSDEGLDVPTLDAPKPPPLSAASSSAGTPAEAAGSTAAKVAAGVGAAAMGSAAAVAAVATSARNKNKKKEEENHEEAMNLIEEDIDNDSDIDIDDILDDDLNVDPIPPSSSSKSSSKKKKSKPRAEAFSLVEALPDRPEDDEFAATKPTTQEPDTEESDDEDNNLLLPTALGGAGAAASARSTPNSLRNLRLSKAGKNPVSGIMDDESVGSSTHTGKRNTNRFSVFHETDTYLPANQLGSAGNSPEGSERGPENDSDSDSDSDSESDSVQSKSSGSSVATTQMVLEEEDEQPSSSHHLAKQLMARLKQQEKQQEQEELQRNLQGIIRRNSQRRLSEGLDSLQDPDVKSALEHSYQSQPEPSLPSMVGTSSMAAAAAVVAAADLDDLSTNANAAGNGASGTAAAENTQAMSELRKELQSSMEELETLREERKFQEARVKELLAALDTKFDDYGDDDDDADDELEEADDIIDSFDEDEEDNTLQQRIGATNATATAATATAESKKRKRMQVFLTQKVDECAELSATVEQLKEQVTQKQAKIEELESQKPSEVDAAMTQSSRSIPKVESSNSIPKPSDALVSSISADLSKDSLQKQLLEKTAECFDLQEQIKLLGEQLEEKDQKYQEVHRDLFTANLALGVEVDRKATAQQALDEKCQEFEAVKTENEELVRKMEKCEERIEALDDELLSRATMLDEMKSKHDEGLNIVATELETTKADLTEKSKELDSLRQRVAGFDAEKEHIINEGSANEKMVGEMKNLLIVESDKREQLELQIKSMEEEKDALNEEMDRVKKENEINKALLQDKKEFETKDGKGSANIQAEVEKLIAENAELKKTLTGVQESEASMKKERERLVANATNMSIMLADSRAKVDFLQMQLEEYKNGPLSNSEHGLKSQSEHGFTNNQSRGFRKLIAGGSTHGTSSTGGSGGVGGGGGMMNDNSERSVGSMGGSQRGTGGVRSSARFRSFLQNRMGGGGAADTATTG